MKKILFAIALFLFSLQLFAQQDPEAKKIIDSFAANIQSYSAYKADIEYIYHNKQTKEKTSKKGSILIKGNKYQLKFEDSEQFFDGRDVYTFLPKSKEVAITKAGTGKNEFFLTNPSNLFNIYQKDYKYKYIGEKKVGQLDCYEIDLFPNDIKKTYFRIRFLIEKETYQLLTAIASDKAGIDYEVVISKFLPNCKTSDIDFVFDKQSNKDVEVIDMR